jgi:two-component system OmpR family response regulator
MSIYRILVVDDEPDIRAVIERSLTRDPGFVVRAVPSGAEAIRDAPVWSPHLILLDVTMPQLDGPTTLAALRKQPQTAAIPVVFLTALALSEDLQNFRALGASGLIGKPFRPSELRAAVHRYLGAAPRTQAAVPRLGDSAEISAEEAQTFRDRLRSDRGVLQALRAEWQGQWAVLAVLEELRTVVHRLAGAAGLFGFRDVSNAAMALEGAIRKGASGTSGNEVGGTLDALLHHIDLELTSAFARSGEVRLAMSVQHRQQGGFT